MSSAISRGPRKSCSVRLMGAPFPLMIRFRTDHVQSEDATPCLLLAQRGGDVGVRAAIVRLALTAWDQDFCRALFGGVGVEALALTKPPGLAELIGSRLAVGRAVRACRAYDSP